MKHSGCACLVVTLLAFVPNGSTLAADRTETAPPGQITFYREKSDGVAMIESFKGLVGKDRDFVPAKVYFQLFVDGKHFARLDTDRFITLTLSAGRHEVRTKRSERIEFNLLPGDHLYVHPGLFSCYKCILARETIAVNSCRDVVADIAQTEPAPVKGNRIYWGETVPETAFPTCH